MDTTLHSLFSTPPRNSGSASTDYSGQWKSKDESAEPSGLRRFSGPDGFCYRHDWGTLDGGWILFLACHQIAARSPVFVSISEASAHAGDHGKPDAAARVRLYDVKPSDGGVAIRVHVASTRPIRLLADYLVITA